MEQALANPLRSLRTVVVVGASSGIGRATAAAFARDGARIAIAARGIDGLEQTAADCRAEGADVLVQATDVTDAAQVEALADAAVARFGAIDVWINMVGVGAVGRFDEVPIDWHRRVVESSLIGHLNGSHAAIRRFRRQGRGTLIQMISIGGYASIPYAASYAASKFGLRGFSEALRGELADSPQIHVCDIYPTFVDTPAISHGANHTGHRLSLPPSLVLVDPHVVASRIVDVSRSPRPTTMVGSVAWPARIAHGAAPNLLATVTAKGLSAAISRADPGPISAGNLFVPSIDGDVRGRHDRRHASASFDPAGTLGRTAALVGLAAAALWLSFGRKGRTMQRLTPALMVAAARIARQRRRRHAAATTR